MTRLMLVVALALIASTARATEVQRRFDWTPLLAATAGQSADVISTHRFLGNGSGCVEGNARYGPQPTTGRLMADKAIPLALTATLVVVAGQPHAPRWVRWTARIVGYGGGAIGATSALRNVRLCGL